MINFSLQDIIYISTISGYLIFNTILFYLPLKILLKEKTKILPFVITISTSFQIIIGYIFYTFRILKIFPTIYFPILILVNFYIIKKKKIDFTFIRHFKINFKSILLFMLIVIPIVYNLFYDSVTHITPDNPFDTYNHKLFFDTAKSTGQFSMAYYPPGFHILLYPSYILLGAEGIYRFSGPILGLLILLNLYFLSNLFLKNRISRILLITSFIFPVFKLLSLQIIYFWPTTLTYLFIPTLLTLLTLPKTHTRRETLLIFFICITALSLTVPYIFLQFLPATIILVIFIWRPSRKDTLPIQFLLLTFLGLITALSHVFIQTQLLSKNGGFPEIRVVKIINNQLITTSNYEISKTIQNSVSPTMAPSTLIQTKTSPATSNKSAIVFIDKTYNRFIIPLLGSIIEAVAPKSILPLSSFSLKAYIWLIGSLILIIFSKIIQQHTLLIYSFYSFMFGIIAQFGTFEFTQYRGRTGPYTVLLCVICLSYVIDHLIRIRPFKTIILVLLALIYILSLNTPPPAPNRDGLCEEVFRQIYLLKQKYSNSYYNVVVRYSHQISTISQSIIPYDYSVKGLETSKNYDTYLILQDNFCDNPHDINSEAYQNDPTYQWYIQNKQTTLLETRQIMSAIEKSPEFNNFTPYWQNANISIYFRPQTN